MVKQQGAVAMSPIGERGGTGGGNTAGNSADEVSAPSIGLFLTEPVRGLARFAAMPLAGSVLSSAPRGDGHGVLVLPGLLASDVSTAVLRRFLRRLGYAAAGWDLGRNRGPTDQVVDELPGVLSALAKRTGRPVSLIGWSLGGIYPTLIRLVRTRLGVVDLLGLVTSVRMSIGGDLDAGAWNSGLLARYDIWRAGMRGVRAAASPGLFRRGATASVLLRRVPAASLPTAGRGRVRDDRRRASAAGTGTGMPACLTGAGALRKLASRWLPARLVRQRQCAGRLAVVIVSRAWRRSSGRGWAAEIVCGPAWISMVR
jgi:hypothetical protein